jgi:nucleoside-diphosphate-sugar epimerase
MNVLVISEPSPIRAPVLEELLRRSHAVRLLASDAQDASRVWRGRLDGRSSFAIDDAITLAAYGCDAAIQLTAPTRRADQGHDTCVDLDYQERLIEAVARGDVQRFVALSAGRGAEGVIRGFRGEWMIVRPGLVYGPDDPVVWPLLNLLPGLPETLPIPHAERRLQPLYDEDLACILTRSLELDAGAMRRTVRVAGPATITVQELSAFIRGHLDKWSVRSLMADAGADAVRQILRTVEDHPHDVDAGANVASVFGVTPTPLPEGLRQLLYEQVARMQLRHTAS